MAIYRGPGGSGDATGDAANEAIVAQQAAQDAAQSATAAANSATSAANSATNAANSATAAATSAANASVSASSASSSASTATTAATNAQTAETNAETAETNANASASLAQDWATKTTGPVAGGEYSSKYNAQLAATSASNASTSASNAASSASSASTSATNASNSASAASTSASNAASSASSASSSASAASTSATNAYNSEVAAASSATSASNSASSASTSASNAATSATNASTSATNAASSASSASTSATNAANSATSASNSASAASTSASNAATSESNTASIYDQFDDRYLGSKTSDPTLDNDGNALLEGALYWNSSTKNLRVYNSTSWQNTANTASGTVTSVDMSVPTGLSVSGNPITTSGTLALTYSAGYSIPTTTKQGQWDTAYSWGNHATAGYLTSESDTLNSVTGRGNTTANSISIGGLTNSGNLTFTGTGNRILGDFSNATFANRVAFQSTTTNGQTAVVAIPNGTGTTAQWQAYNNSDPTNASFLGLAIVGTTDARFTSGISGTGTYLPMTFYTGGSERMRIDTSGNVLVAQASRGTITANAASLSFNMNAASNFTCTPTVGGTLTFTNITAGQSGYILLSNTSGVAITAAATTKVNSTFLSTVSTAGTYLLSYFSNGTNVYVTTAGAMA